MKKLIAKILLFGLLISPPFLLPLAVLWRSGELTPVSRVVRAQMAATTQQVYYAPVYSEPRMLFKLRSSQARRPEILVMGTSRAGQIRSEFFRPSASFYNASMATEMLADYRIFLEHLPPEHLPKLVIAALDQRYFNPNDLPAGSFALNVTNADSPWRVPLILAGKWRKIYADYGAGKFELNKVWNPPADGQQRIGLRAVMLGDGFRNDGSFCYCLTTVEERRNLEGKSPSGFAWPTSTEAEKRRNLEEALTLIDKKVRFFDAGSEVSAKSLEELDRLAAFCQKHQIHLVAFLPPFSHTAYERFQANGNHTYMPKIAPVAQPILERYGFTLHDYTDLASIGIPDSQFFDLVHPTETGMLRLVLKLAEADPVLARYCDLPVLKDQLARANNDYTVFNN